MNVVSRVTNKKTGTWVEVWYDDLYDENPLRDWDIGCHVELGGQWEDAGTKHCPHVVTDKDGNELEFESDNKFAMWLNANGGVAMPIRAYEHGSVGFSVDTNLSYPFNCPWDSYWAGLAYMTPAEIEENYGKYYPTLKERQQHARELIAGEIKLLNAYCNGQIYGYSCYDPEGDPIDSMGGFYDTYDKWEDLLEDMASNAADEYADMIRECDCGRMDKLEVTVTRRVAC